MRTSDAATLDPQVEARLDDDPWALTPDERRDALAACARAQATWLPRLRRLVEPPAPDATFPAFLLGLPCHAQLRRAIGDAQALADLDVGTADELQRFVDHFRTWLD